MGRGEFLGRRGMSPLIATVLLMAFAVALGGMIMNWSIDSSIGGSCEALDDVKVTSFCTTSDSVSVKMRNDGSSDVSRILLKIHTGTVDHDLNVKNSALNAGRSLELSIPFAIVGEASVDLIGVLGDYVCNEYPIERVDPIQTC